MKKAKTIKTKSLIKRLKKKLSKKEIHSLCKLFDEGDLEEIFYGTRKLFVWGLMDLDRKNNPEQYRIRESLIQGKIEIFDETPKKEKL